MNPYLHPAFDHRGPKAGLNPTAKGCGCMGHRDDMEAHTRYLALQRKLNELGSLVAELAAQPVRERAIVAPANATIDATLQASRERLAKVALRIVGGVATTGFPECCLVGRRFANGAFSWFCSGVLVHGRIALTAGHCHAAGMVIDTVAFGVNDENQMQNAEFASVKVAVTNPGYLQTNRFNDITVIILGQPAKTTPVAIASASDIAGAQSTTLVGFGNSDTASMKGFGIKREVDVDFISVRRSASDDLHAAENQYGFDSALEFVAGGEGHDSCNGDSGGPAYINVGGARKVAGLTSRATEIATSPCGEGGIYTRVDTQRDFIREVAAKNGLGTVLA